MYAPATISEVFHSGDECNCCGCGSHGDLARGMLVEANIPDPCRSSYKIVVEDKDWPGDQVMGMDFSTWLATFRRAAFRLEKAIEVRIIIETGNPGDDFFKEAHCKVQFYRFPGQTLADSHVADGTCNDNKRQRYDHRTWGIHLLYLTSLHELMHLLGVRHHNGPYVINPTILTGLGDLTDADIQFLVDVGYKRRSGPVPDPPTPEPEDPKDPPPPEDKMDWAKLIALIFEIMDRCERESGEEKARKLLFGRGAIARWTLRGKLMEAGFSFSQRLTVLRMYRTLDTTELEELFSDMLESREG